ncbi:AhpD-like protein [Nemania sp. FL0916]|nr:AhpD-like protein [Nemania sp. FL0916]
MRLPYIPNPPPASSPEESAIIARISARRAPRPLQPLDLTLLHSPPIADGWNSFLGAVRTKTTLSAACREIAICRVAAVNAAWYEWDHHAPLLVAEGFGSETLRILRVEDFDNGDVVKQEMLDKAKKEGLGRTEWACLRYADEMTRKVKVSEETFGKVREVLGEKGVVELTATVAAYNCVSRFLVALDVGEKNDKGPSYMGVTR